MTVIAVTAAVNPDLNATLGKAAELAGTAAASQPLAHGSDVELARRAARELRLAFEDRIVHCEGEFHFYNGKCWEFVTRDALRRHVHRYDGLPYGPNNAKVRLGKSRIDSILGELGAMLSEPRHFAECRVGINCGNGFIDFTGDRPVLVPHNPDHRQRHVLSAAWRGVVEGFVGSLLERLLGGCFEGDEDAREKIDLIGEIAGAAALGYGTRLVEPKAVVLLGRTAENGKSQVLQLLRGVLPATAVSAVPPSKFGDPTYVVKLAGKYLNTSDELGTAGAISSDTFKYLVTGEPVSARDLYRSAVDFRCPAQHVFACNQLPSFQGGMDRGVMRRLLVLPFNRTIPPADRVEHIALRVLQDELPLVVSFVVAGAARLLQRRRFTEPASSRAALMEWTQGADAVQGWIAERVVRGPGQMMTTRDAYMDFGVWALGTGTRAPTINTFSQRLQAAGLEYKHSGNFKGFIEVRLKHLGEA